MRHSLRALQDAIDQGVNAALIGKIAEQMVDIQLSAEAKRLVEAAQRTEMMMGV